MYNIYSNMINSYEEKYKVKNHILLIYNYITCNREKMKKIYQKEITYINNEKILSGKYTYDILYNNIKYISKLIMDKYDISTHEFENFYHYVKKNHFV